MLSADELDAQLAFMWTAGAPTTATDASSDDDNPSLVSGLLHPEAFALSLVGYFADEDATRGSSTTRPDVLWATTLASMLCLTEPAADAFGAMTNALQGTTSAPLPGRAREYLQLLQWGPRIVPPVLLSSVDDLENALDDLMASSLWSSVVSVHALFPPLTLHPRWDPRGYEPMHLGSEEGTLAAWCRFGDWERIQKHQLDVSHDVVGMVLSKRNFAWETCSSNEYCLLEAIMSRVSRNVSSDVAQRWLECAVIHGATECIRALVSHLPAYAAAFFQSLCKKFCVAVGLAGNGCLDECDVARYQTRQPFQRLVRWFDHNLVGNQHEDVMAVLRGVRRGDDCNLRPTAHQAM